ncbi:hypothetical protein NPIL_677771 [Nephila pilipes]|uniref:Uncharacterized protein n=1 Tax=Nephila pilipes TaxID=299642 RepID=A0A8X6U122_NEPPI|nr:hypothetical protein NPIL_677771 [Nephila pilipes]
MIDQENIFLGPSQDSLVVCDCCEIVVLEIKFPARIVIGGANLFLPEGGEEAVLFGEPRSLDAAVVVRGKPRGLDMVFEVLGGPGVYCSGRFLDDWLTKFFW